MWSSLATAIEGNLGSTELPRVNPLLNLNDCKTHLDKLEYVEMIKSSSFGVVNKTKVGIVTMAVKKSMGIAIIMLE